MVSTPSVRLSQPSFMQKMKNKNKKQKNNAMADARNIALQHDELVGWRCLPKGPWRALRGGLDCSGILAVGDLQGSSHLPRRREDLGQLGDEMYGSRA